MQVIINIIASHICCQKSVRMAEERAEGKIKATEKNLAYCVVFPQHFISMDSYLIQHPLALVRTGHVLGT